MNKPRAIRLSIASAIVLGACIWFRHTQRKPDDVTLLVTFVICVVTAVYSLLTFEILLENQAMSRATKDSASLMEKSLRFPSSAHLSFRTVGTKDPQISDLLPGVAPYKNADFSRALEIAQGGNSEADFVFAVIENKGPGTATKVKVDASYAIVDSGSDNKNVNVRKVANIPILEAGAGFAICISIARLPTPGDGASLLSASIENSDFYRDAIGDPTQIAAIGTADHQTELLAKSTLRIS
jgi:hypothetical protein